MEKGPVTQIAIGVVVGAILGGGGVYLQFASRMARNEARLDALATVNGSTANVIPAGAQSGTTASQSVAMKPVLADSIVSLSADIQRAYVRLSAGELRGQNFSDDDFASFQQNKVAQKAIDSLRHDAHFLAIVLSLQGIDATSRQALVRRAGQPIHRTWAECGRVSPECQTEAGKKAEQILGLALVQEINNLIKRPPEEIRKLSIP